MSLVNRSASTQNHAFVSFVIFALIGSSFTHQMLFNEQRGSISQKRHHTYRRLRQTPLRTSIRSPFRSPSETFALNCPHVTDANNEQVCIEVTWTKDDIIWLKIENGERRIYNKLSSFEKKRVGKKSVLRVTLNKGRYIFAYDELTGDFGMEIRPVIADQDEGIWQCHVTVHQKGDTYTLTSRSRVKNIQRYQQSKDGSPSQLSPLLYQEDSITAKREPISSFTRHEHNTIEINRDTTERQQAVVFDRRTLQETSHGSSTGRQMAIVDYEDDSNANSGYSISGRHNRKRHRHSPNYASTRHAPSILCFLVMTLLIIT